MGAGAVGRAYLFPAGFPVETFGGMFVPFAILMMPLAKQTAEMGLANWGGVILLYVVFYMPMNIMLYSGYLTNIPLALEEAREWTAPPHGGPIGKLFFRS